MYRGKFEAPKGTPKPRRAAPSRRIEDVAMTHIPAEAPAPVNQPVKQQPAIQQPVKQAVKQPVSPQPAESEIITTPNPFQWDFPQAAAPAEAAAAKPAAIAAPEVTPAEPAHREAASAAADQSPATQLLMPEQPAELHSVFQAEPEFPGALDSAAEQPLQSHPVLLPMETLSSIPRPTPAPAQPKPAAQQQKSAGVKKPSGKKKKKKKTTRGTVIFYTCYTVMIVALLAVVVGLLVTWNSYLKRFEKTQSYAVAQTVFDENFASPDWSQLYDKAKLGESGFDGKDQFVQYMTQKVGNRELTYINMPSGEVVGLDRYDIRLDKETLGYFTMSTDARGMFEIAQWEIEEFVIYPPKGQQSVTICVGGGQTAWVNGKELTEDYVVRQASILAEEYLPEGVFLPRTTTYYVDGLLVEPKVEVKRADGTAAELTYDSASKTYTSQGAQLEQMTISDTEREMVIQAAKVLAEYRISARSSAVLARYFDPTSEYYKGTIKQDTWAQSYNSYNYTEPVVTDYYRYSDELFSAHIQMTQNIVRANGIVEREMSYTFFFQKQGKNWLVTDCVNGHVLQEVSQVSITYVYKQDGTEIRKKEMVDTRPDQVLPPVVSIPQGKVLVWCEKVLDENGKTIKKPVFELENATDSIFLGGNIELEPMTLYAEFIDPKED